MGSVSVGGVVENRRRGVNGGKYSRDEGVLRQAAVQLLRFKRPDAAAQPLLAQRRAVRARDRVPRHEEWGRRLSVLGGRHEAGAAAALAGRGAGGAGAAGRRRGALHAGGAGACGGGREEARYGGGSVGGVRGAGVLCGGFLGRGVVGVVIVVCGVGVGCVFRPEVFDLLES